MNASFLADHVVELLSNEGEIVARRMFGGFGIFGSGLMFALIADGILFSTRMRRMCLLLRNAISPVSPTGERIARCI